MKAKPDGQPVNRDRVVLYDTTVRDGTQGEGVSLSCDDKLRIARRLDEFGMAYIEGGWPGSNPKDVEFFQRARTPDDETHVLPGGGFHANLPRTLHRRIEEETLGGR